MQAPPPQAPSVKIQKESKVSLHSWSMKKKMLGRRNFCYLLDHEQARGGCRQGHRAACSGRVACAIGNYHSGPANVIHERRIPMCHTVLWAFPVCSVQWPMTTPNHSEN
jgi:hypothetical protein